jgi:peroxiredoxin
MWTLLLDGVAHPVPLQADSGKLWLPFAELHNLLGWDIKSGTLCRADRCVAVPPSANLTKNELIDLAAFAALLNMPLVAAPEHHAIALAESPEEKTALLQGGTAPDFELTDLAGKTHRLSDYRGRKVLLVTWASWCGCREDLSEWQAQHAALEAHGLTVVTISQDARREDAAPFIEAASPTHPALIDPEHVVSHRYGFINVPTAVWIDESGHVARPPRVEHASNRFSFAHGLDCEPHLAALKNWVQTGKTDFSADETRRKTMPATWEEQQGPRAPRTRLASPPGGRTRSSQRAMERSNPAVAL